ncbi:MAG: HEAT repeat domain-containing protein [Planctomycetes bacterium]|nr:HEAT repeat domain-containing protein [Planctomycetota bacterium]
MRDWKRKTVVCSTAVVALAVLAAGAAALWPLAMEQWWLWRLDSRDPDACLRAVQELGASRSRRAVPGLVRIAGDGLQRRASSGGGASGWGWGLLRDAGGPLRRDGSLEVEALWALSQVGDAAVPLLIEAFGSWSLESWWGFVAAMSGLGEDARPFVPVLEEVVRRGRSFPQGAALRALLSLEKDVEGRVRLLLSALRQESLASEAATYLRNAGPGARAALPLVTARAKHPEPSVRAGAVGAILRMGARPEEALPVLTEALDDPAREVREQAIEQLGDMGPAASAAAPALERAMRGRAPAEVHLAARALKRIRS